MNESEKPIRVFMTRANLENIPEFPLPVGFSARWYQAGDEASWLRIQLAADRLNEITPELFLQQFGSDPALLCQRQCCLLDSRAEPIGTGTAWFKERFEGAPFGRVHWLAVLPQYQRRGLGKALMTILCQRLRELGHNRAYLSTSTARIAAIRLYRLFGFVPLIRNDADAMLWRES